MYKKVINYKKQTWNRNIFRLWFSTTMALYKFTYLHISYNSAINAIKTRLCRAAKCHRPSEISLVTAPRRLRIFKWDPTWMSILSSDINDLSCSRSPMSKHTTQYAISKRISNYTTFRFVQPAYISQILKVSSSPRTGLLMELLRIIGAELLWAFLSPVPELPGISTLRNVTIAFRSQKLFSRWELRPRSPCSRALLP